MRSGHLRAVLGGGLLATLFGSPGVAAAGPILVENLFGGPGPANTVDQGFLALGGTSIESYGFEGNVNLANQQIRINALTGAAPGTFTFNVARNTSFAWVSGREYDFTWKYSGDATKQLSITVTDTVTTNTFQINSPAFPYTATFGGVESLLFRQRTPVNGTNGLTGSSITFKDLQLNSTTFPNVITLNSNGTDNLVNYFAITDFDFTQPWTLSGSVIQAWAGGPPAANRLNWQIKGVQFDFTPAAVPEPTSLAAASVGVVGVAGAALRRRRAGRGQAS